MALVELSPENRRVLRRDDVKWEYRWVNGLDTGEEKANVLECVETGADGERKRLVRATSLELDSDLVLPAPPCPPRLPGSSGLPLPAGL